MVGIPNFKMATTYTTIASYNAAAMRGWKDGVASSLCPPNLSTPENLDEVVKNAADLVGNHEGVVMMHAAEVVGPEMGDENIVDLPSEFFEKLTKALGTEVSMVPEDMTVKVNGVGRCVSTGQRIPLPRSVDRYAIIDGKRVNYHVVGHLEKSITHPNLWGLKRMQCCIDSTQMESYMKIEPKDYHPWKSVVPVLAIYVKPRPPKRTREDETTEETGERQRKKFKSLFVSPVALKGGSDFSFDVIAKSQANIERLDATKQKLAARINQDLFKDMIVAAMDRLDEQGAHLDRGSDDEILGVLDYDQINDALKLIKKHARRSQRGPVRAVERFKELVQSRMERHLDRVEFMIAMAILGYLPKRVTPLVYKKLRWSKAKDLPKNTTPLVYKELKWSRARDS